MFVDISAEIPVSGIRAGLLLRQVISNWLFSAFDWRMLMGVVFHLVVCRLECVLRVHSATLFWLSVKSVVKREL
uniref:Uncharacterized protein n=1 Tax=Schistosoma mansoni TaxID=6183 RepID=A0A5K4F838_SCHMA